MGRGRNGAGRMGRNDQNFLRFDTDDAAFAFMDQAYARQLDNLSVFALEGIEAYTHGKYEKINGYLRGQLALFSQPTEIKDLDSAFSTESAVLKHDLVTVRDFGDKLSDLATLKTGEIFTDPGFVSVSILPHGSGWFFQDKLVEVRLHKGTKALWVANLSKYKEEGELVVARGSAYRVIKQGANGSMPILEVIGQPE
jgi:hypothetical protein